MAIKELTPMMMQYFEIKNKYPNHILFYRLGDFYEMFYDDAITVSEVLGITLTARNAGGGQKAPLCGVPYHSAQEYLQKLIDAGYDVAICEQVEDPKLAKGLVKRKVIKILTKGTITDPQMLAENTNNYLACFLSDSTKSALCYIDVSTFEIEATLFIEEDHRRNALEELSLIRASELLLVETENEKDFSSFQNIKKRTEHSFSKEKTEDSLAIYPSIDKATQFSDPLLRRCIGALLEYVSETQMITVDTEFFLNIYKKDEYCQVDERAIKNLELFETLLEKKKKGSLLDVLDQTKNKMGARLLRQWMRRPLYQREAIEERLNMVDFFVKDPTIDEIRELLAKVGDIPRLVGKLTYSTMLPRDVLRLRQSLEVIPKINAHLLKTPFEQLVIQELEELRDFLKVSISDDPTNLLSDGGYIARNYNQELEELIDLLENGASKILEIETKEREETGIKNLRVRFNKVFGYFIEVTKSNTDMVPSYYIRKQTLVGSERYFTEELKNLEERILSAKEKRKVLEQELYAQVLEKIKVHDNDLLQIGSKLAKVDVLLSFAIVSKRNKYVRPSFSSDKTLDIKDSRHPVIEQMIGRDRFISNDCYMNDTSDQFFVITGPNMAGKSTFLRQIALLQIMAQMGCFVPATYAKLPLVDKIFTRVGASDNLSMGESTFMVEMNELSYILEHATNDSLIVLDEIGRGTSTYDGLSIAWSVIEYLTRKNLHPKTLFATHYHELTEIEERIAGVKNYRITLKEQDGDLIFLRKIVPGRAMHSYGIQAAALAGLPKELLKRAQTILEDLEQHDLIRKPSETLPERKSSKELSKALRNLRDQDLRNITPFEALNMLVEIQKELENS